MGIIARTHAWHWAGCDGIVERRDSAFYKSFAIRMPPDLISEVRGYVAQVVGEPAPTCFNRPVQLNFTPMVYSYPLLTADISGEPASGADLQLSFIDSRYFG
jgi:hypothetical protein